MKKTGYLTCLFVCFLCIFVVGCKEHQEKVKVKEKEKTKILNQEEIIKPLPLSEDSSILESSYGWLNEDTILYSTKIGNQYALISYHIPSKKKKKLFITDHLIMEASISPNKKYILLYSKGSHSQMNIHILTIQGEDRYSVSLPANELVVSWNPFVDDNLVLITSFYEDWTYSSFLCDIEMKNLEEVRIPQPFTQWESATSLMYLELNDDIQQSSAPLMSYSIKSKEKKTLFNNILDFKIQNDVLVTTHEKQSEDNQNQIVFQINKGNTVKSISLPTIADQYGSIVLPYTILSEEDSIVTYIPYKTNSNDPYEESYQLINYNWESNKIKVISKNVKLAPLACSPNGEECLYGNKLENLIHLRNL